MIKVQDQIINFRVQLSKTSKVFSLSLSHVSRLKHISLMICKAMNLDRFNTKIRYSIPGFIHSITEVSTLRQLKIKDGMVITAEITSTVSPSQYEAWRPHFRDSQFGDDKAEQKREKTLREKMFQGLNAVAWCKNSRCRAYGLLKVINLGIGEFTPKQIVNGLVCVLCPHTGISFKPMECERVYLKDCSWIVDGICFTRSGIPRIENMNNNWKLTPGVDSSTFEELFGKSKRWEEVIIKTRKMISAPREYSTNPFITPS